MFALPLHGAKESYTRSCLLFHLDVNQPSCHDARSIFVSYCLGWSGYERAGRGSLANLLLTPSLRAWPVPREVH